MNTEIDKQQDRILELLKESWEDFKKYYKSEIKSYSENNTEGYLVCWKEDDIVLQLSRFFYNRLSKDDALKNLGIEMHSQTQISEITFKKEYSFNKNIIKLVERLNRVKGPKPDFIITQEKDYGSLWLVGEVKYFRTLQWPWEEKVTKDIEELNALRSKHL